MRRVDPAQRARLVDILDNLQARQAEAPDNGWLGEVHVLQVSLDAARTKLDSLDRNRQTNLGVTTLLDAE
jgi:hypothetical protein